MTIAHLRADLAAAVAEWAAADVDYQAAKARRAAAKTALIDIAPADVTLPLPADAGTIRKHAQDKAGGGLDRAVFAQTLIDRYGLSKGPGRRPSLNTDVLALVVPRSSARAWEAAGLELGSVFKAPQTVWELRVVRVDAPEVDTAQSDKVTAA